MKPKLIVMVGIQGSGKSTQAKKLAEEYGNTVVVSSDKIRKDYPELRSDNEKVFSKFYADINYHLRHGFNVIADATNITLKSRNSYFERVKIDCTKIAYVMNTSYETCVDRVEKRNESNNSYIVPLDVVEKYWKSFQCPAKFEGFDEIILHNDFTEYGINDIKYLGIYGQMLKFNQENPNHNHTLGIHSSRVWEALPECLGVDEETLNLINGTDLHDVGKLFTKVPNKKDPSYSSYYSHAEVGGYWKICNGWTPEQVKYETYHMHPYQWKTEKAHNKWKKIFGEEFYNNLLILNKCDIEAH